MTNAQFIRHGLYYLVFLLMFLTRGHQGFFIKHRQSGLCLYPKDPPKVYTDKKIYYVQFQEDKCLHPNAQFHFNNEELLINNVRNGTFLARRSFETKFLVYHGITEKAIAYPKKDRFVLKQTKFGSLSLYKDIERKYCAYPRNPTTLIGSFLIRSTQCHNEKQKFVFGSVTNERKSMTDVNCSPKQVMKVVKAEYGGFNGIFDYNQDAICSLSSACIVKNQCDNKTSCNMNVDNMLFNHDPCPKKAKKLYIEYVCVDSLTKPITKVFSADEIRFSPESLPNKGHIQVLKDSVWQYVSDQNFERRKARDLCQFLGYFDLREVTIKSKRENFKVLSGDLTCRENSCCAHLYSSTSAEVKYKLPHFSCKICSEELKLSDTQKFPRNSFRASISYGDLARISNGGWCFTNRNTAYLQIDLRRDYVITQIATFGNKDGTKWTRSYTLKYSRYRNKLDTDGQIQNIKANTNGFGVAIQTLDNVRARYLKIIPVGEGCMRVELCGHELLPDPPTNLQFDEIESRSVKISWEAPVIKGEGTIFYIITETQQLFNKIEQTQLENNLSGLKPYTGYSVKVSSKNNYGERESAYKSFKTLETAPGGPPLNVRVSSRSTTTLAISWDAPETSVRNGYIYRYKVFYSSLKNKRVVIRRGTSYTIESLQPATKYSVKVAAGTRIGFGDFSEEIINFTNQERVVPVKKTFSSLSLRLEKPQSNMIRSILVIIQAHHTSTKSSDSYQTSELKPYSRESPDIYITAGFSYDKLPIDFIIGDGKPYSLNGIRYVNQRLNENTDYIVFVRFIETEEMYYSTEWSNYVRTYRRPPAPSGLEAISLSHRSLEISWKIPTLSQGNAKLSAFSVCYKEHNNGNVECNKTEPTSSSINIDGLKSSTLYEISIRSRTSIGDSVNGNISKITNEKPIEVSKHTFNGFYIKLPQFKQKVTTVYIIVKHGYGLDKLPADQYRFEDLKAFDKQSPSKPYITAEITTFTDFPQLFEIGNNSKYDKYHNKPLEQNKTYFVFARIVLYDKLYYSTDWTEAIIISALPPAPVIEKIVSYGKKALKISWKQPDLPEGQNVKSHVVTYWLAGNKSKERKLTNSDSTFYILRDLEYEKEYFITVKTKSDNKTSKASKVKSKKTNSEPLYVRVNIDNNYVISLRKSEEDITKVDLIILQLQSNTTEPTPPEDIKLSESPSTNNDKDIAFVAKSYNIGDFEDENLDVILQLKEKDKQRRRRTFEPLKILQRNYTYRFSQWNYNSVGDFNFQRFSVSSWSEAIVIEPEAPYGPPLNVVFYSKSTTTLTVSWNAPKTSVRDGNFDRYKVCYSSLRNIETCVDVRSRTSYTITSLLPATIYFVKVAAGTSVGFGNFSEQIINFTNQVASCPVTNLTDVYKSCKESSKTSLIVGIAFSFCLNIVFIALVVYQKLKVCRARSQSLSNDEQGTKVDLKTSIDEFYEEPVLPNNSETYEELNLKERGKDDHAYQSLAHKTNV